MRTSTVLTVILNYRTPENTLHAAAVALRDMESVAGEIVIVDNDSRDGSFETMSAHAEAAGWTRGGRVRVLQSGRNGGFGAGNNHGMRAELSDGSRPDYYYLLNSDAYPDPGAIATLVDFLDANPDVGIAGGYIHGTDGEPHATAFRFPTVWSELEGAARSGPITRLLARHVVNLPIPTEATRVDWVAGASFMIRRTALDVFGMFDETFFLYFEETELCRRAARHGWSTWYVPASSVAHIGSASTGMKRWTRTPRYWFDSRLHYFTKLHGRPYALVATVAHIAGGLIWRGRRLVQRQLPAGDPPGFLGDLAAHAVRAFFRPARPAGPRSGPGGAPSLDTAAGGRRSTRSVS